MTKNRHETVLGLLDPPKGTRLWFGGPTVTGALRGVSHSTAAWKPQPERHSIWELSLHIAYWKYAVRRIIDGSPKGEFPRSPANWPASPDVPNAEAWKKDRALLRTEHKKLVEAVKTLSDAHLDDRAPDSATWTYADLVFGVVTHDVYHVGQIQILKRLCPELSN